MDRVSIFGVICGISVVFASVLLEGGELSSLFSFPAFLIVFGGTIGATSIGFTWEELRKIPLLLKIVFHNQEHNSQQVIDLLVGFAEKARRDGLLVLEDEVSAIKDPYLRKGLQLVIDGTDSDILRSIMETELNFMIDRHTRAASIFETAGGYAPTMGIIGTVLGLVNVLGNLNNTDLLGSAIATAFIATFYGVASANLIFLPIAAKLKSRSSVQLLIYEIALEGILSVQAGDNPRIVKEKLHSFLAPEKRNR